MNDGQPPNTRPRVTLNEDYALQDWQEQAVESWLDPTKEGSFRGTLEIFTGGGKTIIALAAYSRVTAIDPGAKLAVVVPTEALARQWIVAIPERTSISPAEIGLLGAGRSDTFDHKRVLVSVLNTAAKRLPDLAAPVESLMLVVDECHRAGAPGFAKVLDTPAKYRLGLSATPERDEVNEEGLVTKYQDQIVGQKLGGVVFSFGLREAREIGWLPKYTVHHHGVRLTDQERREYEQLSRKVSDAADRLSSEGGGSRRTGFSSARRGKNSPAVQAYVGAVAQRKDYLYRIKERGRVALALVSRSLERQPTPKILLFHERVTEAESLYESIRLLKPDAVVLEHSDLPDDQRRRALERFRDGSARVMVSVKSLVEGIDVPDADVGVSVASSSSVRQRVQTLGRVLRRQFEPGAEKHAEMHLLYVHDTVDQAIYSKEDWSDLTGADANRYWLWPSDQNMGPEAQSGPPATPKPTEEDEWNRLGQSAPTEPVPWLGIVPDIEFAVDTRGNVASSTGAPIENPQGVAEMVAAVRQRPGGRFRVTPTYGLVIVYGESDGRFVPFVAGRLEEPFRLRRQETIELTDLNVAELKAGVHYPGPTDRANGSFKIRQKRGGVIERKQGPEIQFALTDAPERPEAADNARKVLDAWRSLGTSGLTFRINSQWHAWYEEEGEPRFLAEVRGGLAWPGDQERAPIGSPTSTPNEPSI